MIFRIAEAAKRLGVHPNTLKNLERQGKIDVRRSWAGHRLFSEGDLEVLEEKLFSQHDLVKEADRK